MILLDTNVTAPEENLALDEALLYEAESGGAEYLRFWESPAYFVVLGAGCPVNDDVETHQCHRRGIPILRRCSGGGTVVQGPGCVNYTFILDRERRPGLETIASTNDTVLTSIVSALSNQGISTQQEGVCDLACNGVKISGNAQRRRKRFILFHGTLLHNFELSLISALLRQPGRQPEYRANRDHAAFVRNARIGVEEFRQSLAALWNVTAVSNQGPQQAVRQLVADKYAKPEWNFSF